MHIGIIAGGSGWHVRDLQRAADSLGQSTQILDFRKLQARVGNRERLQPDCQAIIVRTMPPGSLEQVVFRMDLLHRLVAQSTTVLNSPIALEGCIDKYLALAKMEAAGLPVPPTIVCQDADAALDAYARLGGDVVIKPLFGSEGRGMVRISEEELAWRTFKTLERIQAVLYVQKFIPHQNWDLRVFVLGGKVLAAMRRSTKEGWRTNVAQGGQAEKVSLNSDQERLAVQAAQALGAQAAGVDLLQSATGQWFVLEVNAVPGWRALAPATGVDVAKALVQYVIQPS
jgi:ribosomal protein S6--L-glutamate ligase